jgi:DNA polymerase-3 subunit delta
VTERNPNASASIKPAYLIVGDDEGKIDAALARLRARGEREGGPGALESFGSPRTEGPPDADALLAAISAISLIAARRYLLADGVERWTAKQAGPVLAAVGALPPDLTVVLVAREGSKARAPKGLADAVEAAGGEVLSYAAPRGRELPARLAEEARRRGFRLEPAAAGVLAERMGERTLRLAHELDRLALWAGPEGEVTAADLEAMVADTSQEASWALSDAIVARTPAAALTAVERLLAQGEAVTPLVYQAARRLRDANAALSAMEEGTPENQVRERLHMHPYAAKMLIRRLRDASSSELRAASCAIADLEWWTRGGSEYPDDVALTLAVWRASGAGAGAG